MARAPREIRGNRAYQPSSRECAMLLLHLIEAKESEAGKEVSRAGISEATLRRLWCRSRITTEFVHEVQEWLFIAGWVLFFAGSTYAVIKREVVDAWLRISAKRLDPDIRQVRRGRFDFDELEDLLLHTWEEAEDSETE